MTQDTWRCAVITEDFLNISVIIYIAIIVLAMCIDSYDEELATKLFFFSGQ